MTGTMTRRGADRTTVGLAAALTIVSLTAASASAATGPGQAAARARARTSVRSSAGSLLAWGDGTDGQLGDGSTHTSDVPRAVKLPAGTKITSVRAGCLFTLALTASGHVLAWGNNAEGQLGNGTTTSTARPVSVKIPKGVKVTAVRAGCSFGLALTSTGRVLGWGENATGQLGNGTKRTKHVPVYAKLPPGAKVTTITAGDAHSVAVTTGGQALAWGYGADGQLGNGSTGDSDIPVKVQMPAGTTVQSVGAGAAFNIARTSTGLYGWGLNDFGQLGDGDTTSTDVPTVIPILIRGQPIGTPVQVFAGCDHTLVLFSKGGVLAWGYNADGELGDGTTASSDKPVAVSLPAGTVVRGIAAGCSHSLAETSTGQVMAWGYNGDGELGDGNRTGTDVPVDVQITPGLGVTGIASGPTAEHSFAILGNPAGAPGPPFAR
jgi:alpha-tubulin suppressor-like RCC1 family protein